MYYLNNVSKYKQYEEQLLDIVKKEVVNGVENGYICEYHEECLYNIKKYFKGHELSYKVPLNVSLIYETDKYIYTSFLPYYLGAKNMLLIVPHKITAKRINTYMTNNENYLQQLFTNDDTNVIPSISLFPNNLEDVNAHDVVLTFIQRNISLKKLKNDSILGWIKENRFHFDLVVIVDSHCYEERVTNVFMEYFEASQCVFLSSAPLG